MGQYENQVVASLPASGIRVIFDRATKMSASGRRVYQLALGRPDMDTPAHIKEAAIVALRAGMVHYAPTNGLRELRQAITATLEAEFGYSADPDAQILVTVGAGEALYVALAATLNPGDQVLVGEHCWVNYPAIVRMLGADPVFYRMPAERGFEPDLDDLRARVTSRTKCMILNSPTNPTGAVFSEQCIGELAAFAIEHELLVLSDECYRKIVYAGARHVSPLSLPGMPDRTILVDSFSKTFSMTGWRLGYLVTPPRLMPSITKAHQYNCGTACSFGQAAAAVALTSSQACVRDMQEEFARRRNLVLEYLSRMPDLECQPPRGTFYAYPDITRLGIPSLEFSVRLLEMTGVATVPGSSFGPAGDGFVRISYTLPQKDLAEAMALMSEALPSLRKA